MRSLITLISIAALCFIAGYTLGKKHRSVAPVPAPLVTAPMPAAEPLPEAPPAPKEIAIPTPVPAKPPASDRFATRAQMSALTLTDTKDRSLTAELIEASAYSLKVRRMSDQRVLDVPVSMLCEEDQAFAAYLYQTAKDNASSSSGTEADKIWDELFKGM